MNKNEDQKPLSTDEVAALLGAEVIEDIGPVRMDPIGLGVLAGRIAKRLVSTGGRPTDKDWVLTRKVPMKKETWTKLEQDSKEFATQGMRVAPGQLAAIALERGLGLLESDRPQDDLAGTKAYTVDEEIQVLKQQSRQQAAELSLIRAEMDRLRRRK